MPFLFEEHRAFGVIRRTFATPKFFPKNHGLSPNICTQASSSDDGIITTETSSESEIEASEEKGEAKSLSLTIEKLGRGESVASVFQRWTSDGLYVHRDDISHTINRLRKLKFTKLALEVMEWVIRERPYRPKELDYSYLLEFTMKIHGVPKGETLLSRIPSEFRNELVYNDFVLGCLQKGLITLSLAYMKKMRELGLPISYLAFNRLIILHSSPSRRKVIRRILNQMRASKVFPHISTYNILLKIEAYDHNIEGLVKVLGDMNRVMVEPNEVSYCIFAVAHAVARLFTACEVYVEAIKKSLIGDNWVTFDILLIVYGYLGNRKELKRTWDIIQELHHHIKVKSFLLAIEAFGKIGDLVRAKELWHEMESKKGLKSTEQFNSMIYVYCMHGLIIETIGLYEEMKRSGFKPSAITIRYLALGYLKAGLVKESVRKLESGKDFSTSAKVKKSIAWLETTFSMMEIFVNNGDVENVEKLFEELKKANFSRYTFVYNTFIKVYVKARLYEPNLLRKMILGGTRPDSETYSLIKLIEQFRS